MYETFLLVAGGVSFFWISGLIQGMLPVFKKKEEADESLGGKSPVLFNAFLILFFLSILAGLFVWVFEKSIAEILNLYSNHIPYLKILVLYIIFSGPNNLIEYIFLLKNKSKHIITYGIISMLVQLVMLTAPVLLGYDLGYGLYGLLGTHLLRFVLLLWLLNKYSVFRIAWSYIRSHVNLSYPLILSIFLSGSAKYIDGFLVSYHFNEATFAVFRYGARELPLTILLANAFSNAMIPEFADRSRVNVSMQSLKDKSRKLMRILFPITIALLLSSKFLYPIVFNPDFSRSAEIFNVYLLLIISRLIFPQTILIGRQYTKIIMQSSLFELIINVVASVLLIREYGIIGVAYATVIAFFFQKIYMVIYTRKSLDIRPATYIPVREMGIWSFLTVAVYLAVVFLY